jgi:RNA polymerase sigma factor (sigma-70 family)
MGSERSNFLTQYLNDLAEATKTRDASDQELVEAFSSSHNEAAFKALLGRHGAMVLSVCRRVLRNEQDAEDAFQATFLVLARKARSLRTRTLVGNWLYGVAYRTALKARSCRARAQARESDAPAPRTPSAPLTELTVQEAQRIVDQELEKLPEKFRAPLVLCCLEGLARDEAARQLGWPTALVKSRLEQARELLHSRLLRRGLTLPGGLVSIGLLETAARAAVPLHLVTSTGRAALAVATGGSTTGLATVGAIGLFEGMVRTMFWGKIKTVAAGMLILALLGVGTAGAVLATKPRPVSEAAVSGGNSAKPPLVQVDPQPGEKPAKVPALKAETLERWSRADVILIANLVKVDQGPVAQSLPPIYNHTLHFQIDKVLRGSVKKDAPLSAHHAVKQANAPTFPVGKKCLVGLRQNKNTWQVIAVEEVTGEKLAEVEIAAALPIGWSVEKGRLVSPWAKLGAKAWPAAAKVANKYSCATTGRPAFLAGTGVELTVEPVPPKEKLKYGNPDGDGEYKITVANPTDKPIAVPALLSDKQGKILWNESLVILCQGKTYPIPDAQGVKEVPVPTVLKPKEKVSTVVHVFKLQGPEWPRGGYRIEFQFCLGEKSVTQSFYYLSKHHDPIREKLVGGKQEGGK